MAIELKMPALSPTMESGTLAKWLVKEGDSVSAGDVLAEIETDKATMEFETIDDGVVSKILIPEGTENVLVGTPIAMILEDEETASATQTKAATVAPKVTKAATSAPTPAAKSEPLVSSAAVVVVPIVSDADRVKASPLARRLAEAKGINLSHVTGSGPNGRVVKADILSAQNNPAPSAPSVSAARVVTADGGAPYEIVKLSSMRKTIARRLTESKQQVPHIYLTVDIRLDELLKLRGELNTALAPRGVKLSVNDLLIKALGVALARVPACNVSFNGDTMLQYQRADISVAVSIPNGLITPIVASACSKSVSEISTEIAALAMRAKEGKLLPHEYQGGTASLSNMGMMGIKQFDAVINPPQAMIMAIGAGEQRPYVINGELGIATVMSATGSFDHRAIDGSDGAALMKVFKELIESPLGLLV